MLARQIFRLDGVMKNEAISQQETRQNCQPPQQKCPFPSTFSEALHIYFIKQSSKKFKNYHCSSLNTDLSKNFNC
jgi:hypothetical protein